MSVPVFVADPTTPGDRVGWSDADNRLLIEEGRRQIDRQIEDLERIRTRSAFLVTTSLGLVAAAVAVVTRAVKAGNPGAFLVFSFGLLAVVLGLLGAASLLTAQSEIGTIHTALLSDEAPPVLDKTAKAYAKFVSIGENTVATRLTVFRDAVTLLGVGGLLEALAWFLTL